MIGSEALDPAIEDGVFALAGLIPKVYLRHAENIPEHLKLNISDIINHLLAKNTIIAAKRTTVFLNRCLSMMDRIAMLEG